MTFINYRTKENSLKCQSCKFNLVNNYTPKVDDKGFIKFFEMDDKVLKALKVGAKGTMWAACKACPNRKDFVTMNGVEPVEYFSNIVK